MSNYGELLKDPRWQKKRLEIMERDDFACQCCGERYKTLNVHHMWYGPTPWGVPNNSLVTMCEDCHKAEEGAKNPYTAHKALKNLASSANVPIVVLFDFLSEAVVLTKTNHPSNFPVKRFRDLLDHLKTFK